jgi:polysaccharide biosynthesis/export protein
MKHKLSLLAMSLLAIGLFGCATNHPRPSTASAKPLAFYGGGAGEPGGPVFSGYHLQSDDALEIQYYFERSATQSFQFAPDQMVEVKFIDTPQLNELQPVRPDGNISLPYLGDIFVAGMTPAELTGLLKERYASILKSTELYVVVREYRDSEDRLMQELQSGQGARRLLKVRPDGGINFSRIGDLMVRGRTLPDLAGELNQRYSQIHPNLRCNLLLSEHADDYIYVMGQVEKPGAYRLERPINVLKALSLAGGHPFAAKLSEVVVMRMENGAMQMRVINLEETLRMGKSARFLMLQPDDLVYVPPSRLAESAELAREISDILFFRGWGFSFSYDLNKDDTRTSTQRINTQEITLPQP